MPAHSSARAVGEGRRALGSEVFIEKDPSEIQTFKASTWQYSPRCSHCGRVAPVPLQINETTGEVFNLPAMVSATQFCREKQNAILQTSFRRLRGNWTTETCGRINSHLGIL